MKSRGKDAAHGDQARDDDAEFAACTQERPGAQSGDGSALNRRGGEPTCDELGAYREKGQPGCGKQHGGKVADVGRQAEVDKEDGGEKFTKRIEATAGDFRDFAGEQ